MAGTDLHDHTPKVVACAGAVTHVLLDFSGAGPDSDRLDTQDVGLTPGEMLAVRVFARGKFNMSVKRLRTLLASSPKIILPWDLHLQEVLAMLNGFLGEPSNLAGAQLHDLAKFKLPDPVCYHTRVGTVSSCG